MMCAMVMQGQGQQHHQGGANAINLKVYNTNKRKAIPAIEDAPAKDEPSEAKVAEDPPAKAAPAPPRSALFTLPAAADDSQEAAEAMVEEHLQTMNQAYGARPKGGAKSKAAVKKKPVTKQAPQKKPAMKPAMKREQFPPLLLKDGTEVSAAVRARFPERFSKCRWVRGCARSCFDLNRRRLD